MTSLSHRSLVKPCDVPKQLYGKISLLKAFKKTFIEPGSEPNTPLSNHVFADDESSVKH